MRGPARQRGTLAVPADAPQRTYRFRAGAESAGVVSKSTPTDLASEADLAAHSNEPTEAAMVVTRSTASSADGGTSGSLASVAQAVLDVREVMDRCHAHDDIELFAFD